MATAYSYIRFSSAIQEKGDSLRRQLDLSVRYAAAHGLVLDETLDMRDLGLSAFDKTNVTRGALGAFLEAVRKGQIKPGSHLLVESLDRLSRAQVLDALEVFISILNAGIIIVTLADEQVYSRESMREDFSKLLISITIMSRAYEESAMKSKRIGTAWVKKREIAGTKRLTKMCPNWLRPARSGGWEVREGMAKIINYIFELKAEGWGKASIAKRLNEESVPTFVNRRMKNTDKYEWHAGTIQQLLLSRSLLGEFQPHTGRDAARTPVGDPIPDYYPRIISDELWAKSRSESGTRRGGKNSPEMRNVFRGLLRCAKCGGTVTGYFFAASSGKNAQIGCYNRQRGTCEIKWQWPYKEFLASAISALHEIKASNLLDTNEDQTQAIRDYLAVIKTRIADVESRSKRLMEALETGSAPTEMLLPRLNELSSEREKLLAEHALTETTLSQAEAASSQAKRSIEEIDELVALLDEDQTARMRLNKLLHTLIDRIDVRLGGPAAVWGITLPEPAASNKALTRSMTIILRNGKRKVVSPFMELPAPLGPVETTDADQARLLDLLGPLIKGGNIVFDETT